MEETVYYCKFITSPNGEPTQKCFNSLRQAKKYAREIITNIKPKGYFEMLKGIDNSDGKKVAKVLKKFLSDPSYEIGEFSSEYSYDKFDEEGEIDEIFYWKLNENGFNCGYDHKKTGDFFWLVLKNPNTNEYWGSYSDENYSGEFINDREVYGNEKGSVYGGRVLYFTMEHLDTVPLSFLDADSYDYLSLVIDEVKQWPKRDYPLMILGAIQKKPLTISDIQEELKQKYNASIDKKTIESHINEFSEFGIKVEQNSENQYFIKK